MIVQPIPVFQNNYGYELQFTLNDGLGNPVDLTGANLTLSAQYAQDPTHTVLPLSGSMGIDNATAGVCNYNVAAGDFPNPATLLVQITATYGSEVLTWQEFQIIVAPALLKTIN
jgi:hypothetical protein